MDDPGDRPGLWTIDLGRLTELIGWWPSVMPDDVCERFVGSTTVVSGTLSP